MFFIVVVNPFNGPGKDAIPDSNYTREIARLTVCENVQLLGYVHVTYTRRKLAEVLRDITTYSDWATSSHVPGLKVNGIFVDESPNSYEPAAEIYLKSIYAKVKASNGLGPANTVSNQFLNISKLNDKTAASISSNIGNQLLSTQPH